MSLPLSRRDFLHLGTLTLGCIAFRPFYRWLSPIEEARLAFIGIGRVTIREVMIYSEPSFQSMSKGVRLRDELVGLYETIISSDGPADNPRWYRVDGGFIHSAYIQRVEDRHINTPLSWIPTKGRLGEVTVPYTRSYRYTQRHGWIPLYRLYYQSIHWITGIDVGPDRRPWYELTDELLHIHYHVPATHVRPIHSKELTPITPEVPPGEKRIEVSLEEQILNAYEGDNLAMTTQISSGIPTSGPTINGIPTATPRGRFHIAVKMPSKHMGNGRITDNKHAYELLGVPWCCFFHETGVAFHGTYWHDNFGSKMSHGCVNMRIGEAKWLYRWTKPEAEPADWDRKGYGTRVSVY